MKRLVILVTGFGMPHWLPGGIPGLARAIQEEVSADTEVKLFAWNSVAEIVNYILAAKPDELILAGHSYGASTCAFVAKRLAKAGVKVDHMVLTDPVWRLEEDDWTFKSFQEGWEIEISTNVENLYCYFQVRGFLTGHNLICDRTKTNYLVSKLANDRGHIRMDRYSPFLKKVKELALAA